MSTLRNKNIALLLVVLFLVVILLSSDQLFYYLNSMVLCLYLNHNALVATLSIILFISIWAFYVHSNRNRYELLIRNDVKDYKRNVTPLLPDTPCREDLLKRDRYARYLSDIIFQTYYTQNEKGENLHHSFVIHIGERYGQGKTSFLLMFKKHILQNANRAIYIDFRPWLCDNEESIIREFFKSFVKETSFRLPGVQHSVKKYMSLLLKSVSLNGIIGLTLDWNSFMHKETIKEIHDEIRNKLSKIDRPIVVAIDDVDRLQSGELMMVLKLIRDVADFPNVYYIIAADNRHLESILKAKNIANSSEYLKKFFNLEFQLPANENVAVRVLLGNIERQLKSLSVDAYMIQDCLSRIGNLKVCLYIFANLREVYRFQNVLNMQFDLMKSNGIETLDYYDLFCLTVLKFRTPEFYLLLRDNFERILDTDLTRGCDSLLSLKKEYSELRQGKGDAKSGSYLSLIHDADVTDGEIVMALLNELFGKSKRIGAYSICRMNMFYKYFASDIAKNVIDRMELLESLGLPDYEYKKKIESFFQNGKAKSVMNEFPYIFKASGLASGKFLIQYLTFMAISYRFKSPKPTPQSTLYSEAGYMCSDKVKSKLTPILTILFDSKLVNFNRKQSSEYLKDLKDKCEHSSITLICPLMVCLHIMRENTKDYLFLPQDMKDLYFILVQRFVKEVMAKEQERLTEEVVDTLYEIIGSPFANKMEEKPICWQWAFINYLTKNKQVFIDCLKKQVVVSENGDIEWNDRYNKIYFSATHYIQDKENLLLELSSTYLDMADILQDLDNSYKATPRSLQGYSLANNAYFVYIKGHK